MTQFTDGQGPDQAGPERQIPQVDTTVAKAPRGLARWYWGTAGLLIVTALGVTAIADKHLGPRGPFVDETAAGQAPEDGNAAWADEVMRRAEGVAMAVVSEIDPELDRVFVPVYAGIPDYMEFHYSLKGEWLELGAAVLGQMESQLDQQLFNGLDGRVASIAQRLQADFDGLWLSSVEDALAQSSLNEGPIAELAERSVRDARDRIRTTAAVYGGLGAGAVALSVLPRVVASKLGPKIAGKVAVKTGARLVTVASGAGTGAALCSWAGPGAAACAAVGMAVSWVGVDYAMINLDKHVSQEEFEQDLHVLVDEQKAAIRDALQDIVVERLLGAQAERKEVVMTISLAELPDYDKRMACEAAAEIAPYYARVIDSLHERSPVKVDALFDLLAQHEDNRLLAPWVDRVENSILDADLNIRLNGDMKIKVQVPQGLQNGHEMRANLTIGEMKIASDWVEPNSYGNFVFRMPITDSLALLGRQQLDVDLRQDGGLGRRDRRFEGQASFSPHSILPDRSGLTVIGETAVATWSRDRSEGAPRVWVEVPVSGAALEGVAPPQFCTS